MESILSMLAEKWWLILLGLAALIFVFNFKNAIKILGVYMIPEDRIGIVSKKFSIGRSLATGKLVALNGEAGLQADTLPPGLKLWLWPWQYKVNIVPFTTINEGYLGIVETKDGDPIPSGEVLAKHVGCNSYQDARLFLTNGGQRGPQITHIPPGTYRINTELFAITQVEVTEIPENMMGVVTTWAGAPLINDDIAGKPIEGHNSFQNAQAFITNGGTKGLQDPVILAGRYYLNPKFATVVLEPLIEVPIACVGVVISFVGDAGKDVTGESFEHANIVSKGEKGVWMEVLDPGKYALNPRTHKVEIVSTANIVLNWATGRNESHKLDEKLNTISVRSADGFSFNLDVSQIIHVPRKEAPKVIARFGNMQNLVTQVLEPLIGNYFRNSAQQSDAITFLKSRSERQKEARDRITTALKEYNVNGVDTLIGDINAPPELMKTLTDRKIAEQEQTTYATQMDAEVIRQKLEQAKATANTQAEVVTAERRVEIADFDAKSAIKKAEGEAKSKKINAEADAEVLKVTGAAEGEKITAVGEAQAKVVELMTEAQGKDNYALVEAFRSMGESGQKWVPEITVGGSEGGKTSGLVDVLMANLVTNTLKAKPVDVAPKEKATKETAEEKVAPAATVETPAVKAKNK